MRMPAPNTLVALDCETSGLHPDNGQWLSVVSLAWYDQGRIVSEVYPFDHGVLDKPDLPAGVQADLFTSDQLNLSAGQWRELGARLQTCKLVGHNLKFDLLFAWRGLRTGEPGWDLVDQAAWDTAVVNPLLWPDQSVALKATAKRLWGEEELDTERKLDAWLSQPKHKAKDVLGKRQKRYDLAPWELLGPYAAKDAELTLKLAAHQYELIDQGLVPWEVVSRELDLMRVLHLMERRGIGFDLQQARVETAKLKAAAQELAHSLPFKPPTQAAARRYFFEELKHPPSKVTDQGQPSVDEEAVRYLVDQHVPGAADWAHYVKVTSAVSKWYEGWGKLCGPDERLRCVFHQTKNEEGRGTVSGRLSVQRVQLQAVPHDYQMAEGVRPVRDLFKASPGLELWELDLSQAEFRVAAAVAQEDGMLAEFAAGHDAHDATCRLVFQVDPDHELWEQYRAVSKRLGFGILYGAGSRKIQEEIAKWTGLVVTVDQVDRWLQLYGERMPKMLRMGSVAERLAKQRGYVRLAGGRQRWFGPQEETRKAWNAVVQGSVAELMKEAMVRIEQERPGLLVSQVHDSVWVEVPGEPEALGVGRLLGSVFEDYYQHAVAFPTGAKRLDK
jgi:DNA polymerase I-like protein with 3'-5' exonuclease and polymerase domains